MRGKLFSLNERFSFVRPHEEWTRKKIALFLIFVVCSESECLHPSFVVRFCFSYPFILQVPSHLLVFNDQHVFSSNAIRMKRTKRKKQILRMYEEAGQISNLISSAGWLSDKLKEDAIKCCFLPVNVRQSEKSRLYLHIQAMHVAIS